jgi:prepilin-type processing-associated H-X9-DG protein
MATLNLFRASVCIGNCCFLLVCSACSPVLRTERTTTPENSCSNNLARIFVALRDAVGESGAYYPKSFKELPGSIDPNLFVCSESKGLSGSMSDVEDWTDLIYVGNLTYCGVTGAALVISPPENHGGYYGYVLFCDGSVAKLPAQQVRKLIDDPFAMATLDQSPSNTVENIKNERSRAVVNVPKMLKKFYGWRKFR